MDRIVQMGMNSPGSRPEGCYTGPPVGYIPADQPGGPRDLPPDRYSCPFTGCHGPFGPGSEGYSRRSLGFHIRLPHGGADKMWEVRLQVREHVMALRLDHERHLGPTSRICAEADDPMADFQRQMDTLISDLDKIREWEYVRRFIIPKQEPWDSVRRVRLNGLRLPLSELDGGFQGDCAEEGGSSLPSQSRLNRIARERVVSSPNSRDESHSPKESGGNISPLDISADPGGKTYRSPRSVGRSRRRDCCSPEKLDQEHRELRRGGNSMTVDQ